MKRMIAMTAATLMGATMLAGPAFAEMSSDKNGSAQTETGVTGGAGNSAMDSGSSTDTMGSSSSGSADTMESEIDTGSTAAIDAEASFDGALSAINGSAQAAATIESMTEPGSVEIVRIDELEGADMDALETATSENSDAIDELHAAIDANTAVSGALEAEDVTTADVVAAETGADGSLTVYVR